MGKKSTKAEMEKRVTAIYQLLMRQESYQNIVRYASVEWQCTSRQTDNYISRARELMAQEAAIARRHSFDEQLVIRRTLFAKAYTDKKWKLCLDILKDQCSLMDMYPSRVGDLEAVKQLVDANVVPMEVLEKISVGTEEFRRTALEAFKTSANI